MSDTRLALTDRSIAGLPPASSRQYFARDTELPGFAVLVGKRRKTFVIQGDIRKGKRRFSIRLKIGAVGEKTTREARAEAKELLGKIAKGIDPREKNQLSNSAEQRVDGIPTLLTAWQRYQESHVARKGLSGTTINNYRDHVERLMSEWLDKPLSVLGLDPSIVASRHDKITREHGPYIVNACMRSLRANWVFPADSASGHLAEHKEDRQTLLKWGNDLRQTYRTVAQAAGIANLDIHLLMNHSVAGVNAGYITRSKLLNNHLRWQQEAISRQILGACLVRLGDRAASTIWLTQPSRRLLMIEL
jgi:hypothetical protein